MHHEHHGLANLAVALMVMSDNTPEHRMKDA